jgi:hypothetical protein
VRFAGITKIFLVEKGRAKEVQVSTGVASDQWIEIAGSRIPADAQVVTSGQTVLADGTPVYVRPSSVSARASERQPARD